MPSSRKPRSPLTLGRLIGSAAVGVGLAASTQAEYHVTAFGDTAGFERIMAGEYASARDELATPAFDRWRFALHTNRCVAQLKLADRGQALGSCERAVTLAPADLNASAAPVRQHRAGVLTAAGGD